MRNALDRSYRDRHLIHRLHRAVTLESDLYSGVRQKPLISKNVLDKDISKNVLDKDIWRKLVLPNRKCSYFFFIYLVLRSVFQIFANGYL